MFYFMSVLVIAISLDTIDVINLTLDNQSVFYFMSVLVTAVSLDIIDVINLNLWIINVLFHVCSQQCDIRTTKITNKTHTKREIYILVSYTNLQDCEQSI